MLFCPLCPLPDFRPWEKYGTAAVGGEGWEIWTMEDWDAGSLYCNATLLSGLTAYRAFKFAAHHTLYYYCHQAVQRPQWKLFKFLTFQTILHIARPGGPSWGCKRSEHPSSIQWGPKGRAEDASKASIRSLSYEEPNLKTVLRTFRTWRSCSKTELRTSPNCSAQH